MRKEDKAIGVGVLGYGAMGKAHTHAYKDLNTFFGQLEIRPSLVALYGRTKANVERTSKELGYERFYTDWRKMINDRSIELVDNTLPNKDHYEPSVYALESGRHVFCEKPLATTYSEALEMYNAAKRSGMKHGIGFNYRWLPAVRVAKKLLDQGYIGNAIYYRAAYHEDWATDPTFPLTWRFLRETAGTGVIGDVGTHIIDLGRFLVGEISKVCGISRRFIQERPLPDLNKKGNVENEDAFSALLEFDNGAFGVVEASRTFAGRKNFLYFEVQGSDGLIIFDLDRLNEVKVFDTAEQREKQGLKTIFVTDNVHPYFKENFWPTNPIGWAESFTIEIDEFLKSIVADREFEPGFYDGAVDCAVTDSILHSIEKSTWISVPKVPK